MGNLQNRIRQDYQAARLLRSVYPAQTLQTLLGEFDRIGKELDDAKVVAVVQKNIASLTELLNLAPEKFPYAVNEIDTLEKYVPKMLTEAELDSEIRSLIALYGANQGKVMSGLKEKFPGQYDGKAASATFQKYKGN